MAQVSAVDDIVSEYQGIEAQMADPETMGDQMLFRKLSKRYSELQPIINVNNKLVQARDDYEVAKEMAHEDHEFQEEAARLETEVVVLEEQLADLLAPRDPHDGDDIVMEVKAGAGGEEAALFAGELVRMYQRYADKHGFAIEVLDSSESDLGGVKDMTLSIRSKTPSRDGAWSVFKFEGGVHRVQRVPVTESQGRIQTSAAGVLVYPEPDEVAEIEIDDKDLRIDVYRSSGKGGQGVNTTDSAVRITHLPTGLVVTCQKERSQIQNKARAMQVLAARLQSMAEEQAEAEAAEGRAAQIRTMDRSERIRTYNWPENRISDHRIGFKANNLDSVLNGELDDLFTALRAAERAERLEAE
ncbi:peptide chain release factor 1 [Corynebacterium pseudotuberculosis]|uniref:Peptide chain release factor 1 n=2 Tax=Corynebacterium pseudotuberculosis TaxID=1719 RepID=D9Q9U3_CORP2|nr:peptide chain release factor 1 [Corynebacterium pseudotuberculosis]AER68901.1 Peptide chain release factor 1 [Corynebacterium pseudotuberculosis 1/06-A]ADK28632.1 peptide chain release factor 1 [Corynebacterium pseudotuberculosis FRC41]ADL10319.1 peptide chain release factor 1 [Corynebacterium pseudotuberculosis C231]ADL20724.1 peptide chain release factor 1 [Corynebacterium pseudotuberculosis 1002]ADO26111.1 peptide chain release factor 1 [Corynebacterium pseudotuberculosis I19]